MEYTNKRLTHQQLLDLLDDFILKRDVVHDGCSLEDAFFYGVQLARQEAIDVERAQKAQQDDLRTHALGKLTEAERAALGLTKNY